MTHQQFKSLTTLGLFFTDLAAGVVALFGAYVIRFWILAVPKGYDPEDYKNILLLAVVLWMMARFWAGLHRSRQRPFSARILRRIVKCSFLAILLMMSAAFYTQIEYSRKLPPILFVSGVVVLAAFRFVADRVITALQQRHGWGVERVALVGISQTGAMTVEKLKADRLGTRLPLGFIAARSDVEPDSSLLAGFPILGTLEDLDRIVEEHGITEVFVTDPAMEPREVLDLMIDCEKKCLKARVVPNVLETMLTDSHMDELAGIPLLGLRESRLRGGNVALKWAFDVTLTVLALIVLAIPLLVIALLVKLTSRGPLLYKQERIGLDGQRFNIYKFRTMRPDAEVSGPQMTKPGDPRVTPLGRFLRAWNLDELPQLFNVLAGHMSLVGPRPERPYFVEQFKEQIPYYMARHKVKAGITGWAQVNGLRGDTSIAERLQYDLYYVKNWSIWFDLKILCMTLLARENAY